jgi:hypothetical protein
VFLSGTIDDVAQDPKYRPGMPVCGEILLKQGTCAVPVASRMQYRGCVQREPCIARAGSDSATQECNGIIKIPGMDRRHSLYEQHVGVAA